jgi:hypothetical protein
MNDTLWAWSASAAILALAAVSIGWRYQKRWYGAIIDSLGRCSLSKLQLLLWTVILLSLFAGVFVGWLRAGVASPLEFDIPGDVLALAGISVSSTVLATTIKEAKNNDPEARHRLAAALPLGNAAADPGSRARFSQVFLVEEGFGANRIVDVTKFQNFWLTLLLAAAFISTAIAAIRSAPTAADIVIPKLGTTFLTLLGISHAGYLAGKMPARAGDLDQSGQLSVAKLQEERVA